MDFIEGGIYRPIRVMFDTPIYERALQTCWHMGSYKCQIALMSELLRLQQKNQLPSAVTAEDITEFLVEESKCTLRVQLWEFELEDYDLDVRPLLRLAWEVNNSMKMRDIEFEATRLLSSPQDAPHQFKHPKIISEAQKYARRLTEQQQEARGPKQLSPREVVMEVVPKVLQGFWLPPPNTFLNMPSQQLCTMAVGVTKAVEDRVSTALSTMLCQVPFSRSIRDSVVQSIQEKVRQGHAQDVLLKNLNCFATEALNTIADVAAEEISVLFQPQTNAGIQPAVSLQADEPPVIAANQEDMKFIQDKPVQQPISSPEPPPETQPAELIPSVLECASTSEEPTGESNSAVLSAREAPPNKVPVITAVQNKLMIMGGFSFGFFRWLKRKIYRCFLTENNTEMR